jgi:DMSO/TMAO reductase YedYZ molybdopterin-dependent catalytic subunit
MFKFFQKPEPEQNDRVPPGQYLTNGFPIMTYGQTPHIPKSSWKFRVWGLASEKTFTWEELLSLPQHEFTADFHCVTRWSKLDVKWKGIKISDLMAQIEVDPRAAFVVQHCYGGYTTNVPLADFLNPSNFLAFELSGEKLPDEHGGPLRSVIPHLYAWKSAKWINGIEFLDRDNPGFWERNGYHDRGNPWTEERYS